MQINEAKKLIENIESGKQKQIKMDDEFNFKCTKCGKCCFNNSILLNIYDLIRLRNSLGLSTSEILSQSLINITIGPSSGLPVASLNFDIKYKLGISKCPFLESKNSNFVCHIHKDRPLVCRLFPCGRIRTVDRKLNEDKTTWILQEIDKDFCNGFDTKHKQKLKDFLSDAEFNHFDEGSAKFNTLINNIINRGYFAQTNDNKNSTPKPLFKESDKELLFLANIMYNFDSFILISSDERAKKTISNKKSTHEDFMYLFNKIEILVNTFINKN